LAPRIGVRFHSLWLGNKTAISDGLIPFRVSYEAIDVGRLTAVLSGALDTRDEPVSFELVDVAIDRSARAFGHLGNAISRGVGLACLPISMASDGLQHELCLGVASILQVSPSLSVVHAAPAIILPICVAMFMMSSAMQLLRMRQCRSGSPQPAQTSAPEVTPLGARLVSGRKFLHRLVHAGFATDGGTDPWVWTVGVAVSLGLIGATSVMAAVGQARHLVGTAEAKIGVFRVAHTPSALMVPDVH